MPERLVELYHDGDRVLVYFAMEDRWLAGCVIARLLEPAAVDVPGLRRWGSRASP